MLIWNSLRKERVIYEDANILVLNKPPGISVEGDQKGDILTLIHESGGELLPAHRIDKETSGALLFAKDQETYSLLAEQFAKRLVEKAYLAVVISKDIPKYGKIELPLSLGRKKKVRVGAERSKIEYDKKTNTWFVHKKDVLPKIKTLFSTTLFWKIGETQKYSILLIKPVTGRRHQIRVHLAWIGYPIVGDPLFDPNSAFDRTFLHSWYISFMQTWKDKSRIEIVVPPGEDFWVLVKDKEIIKGILTKAKHIPGEIAKVFNRFA